jgi:hypothetical protein
MEPRGIRTFGASASTTASSMAFPYAGGAYVIYVYVNKTMWNELGLDEYPKTLGKLIEAAKAGKSTEKGTWGYLASSSAPDSSYFD